MRKTEELKKFYRLVGTDSLKARQIIKKLDYAQDPYLLQCIAQTYFDESIFEKDDSLRDYFDGRKLRLAERYAIKAFNLNPGNADVLWILGKIRHAYKQNDLAIYCFKRIIELGEKSIINGDGQHSVSYAKMKINDSKFQLYRVYHDMSDELMSKKYLGMYKNGLKKGTNTIFKPLVKFLLS